MSWLDNVSSIEFLTLLLDSGLIGRRVDRTSPLIEQPIDVEAVYREGQRYCGVCKQLPIHAPNNRCRLCYVKYRSWKERTEHVAIPVQMQECPCGSRISMQAKLCHPCRGRARREYNRDYHKKYRREKRLVNRGSTRAA